MDTLYIRWTLVLYNQQSELTSTWACHKAASWLQYFDSTRSFFLEVSLLSQLCLRQLSKYIYIFLANFSIAHRDAPLLRDLIKDTLWFIMMESQREKIEEERSLAPGGIQTHDLMITSHEASALPLRYNRCPIAPGVPEWSPIQEYHQLFKLFQSQQRGT